MPSPNESQRVVALPPQKTNENKMKSIHDDKTMKKTETGNDFTALIGLDWGSETHALCLYDWGRPHFVHQSFFEYASQSVLHCAWAKLFLQKQIAKGKKHPTAVRALAFKWPRKLSGLARPRRL